MLIHLSDILIRFRWPVVIMYIIISSILLYFAGQIGYEFSFRQFFPEDNPLVQFYDKSIADFGDDDTSLLIAMEGDNLFSREVMSHYKQYHEAVAKLNDVMEVDSIINVNQPQMVDDTLYINELFEDLPEDPSVYIQKRDYLLNNELYRGSFISTEGDAVLMIAKIDQAINHGEKRKPLLRQLEALNRDLENKSGTKVTMGGVPWARSGYTDLMTYETNRLTAWSAVLIIFILIYTFKHWAGVVFSQVVVLLAVLGPIGLMSMLGIKITLMSTMLPVIVMITGVANSIHYHTRFYEELHKGASKREAIREATRHLAVALFITSVTTSVGFSILATTEMRVLGEFGLFVAVGVMCAYFTTITLLPAVLAILPKPSEKMLTRFFSGQSKGFLKFVHRVTTRHRVASVTICLIVGLLAAYFASTMERKQKILEDLDDDHPIIASTKYFEKKLGGVQPMDVVLETDKKNGIKEPVVMRFAEEVKKKLETFPQVRKTYAVPDMIKEISQILNDGDPAQYRVPDTRQAVAQYMMLYNMGEKKPMESLVSPRYESTRISTRIEDEFSTVVKVIFADIRTWLAANSPPGVSATLTGLSPVAHMINDIVVDELFYTFIIALGIITLLLIAQFRSIRVGLFSLIPNMLPLTVLLGMIGMLSINLKPSSCITFSIALGIAVDDTVHYIARFLQEYKERQDVDHAAEAAIFGTGRAMVFTTVVLASGFAVPVLISNVRANAEFSILSVGAVLTALLADLFLLPVILPLLFRGVQNAEGEVESPEHA